MGPGPLIAIDVILLYTVLGPLVLFGIYTLFDALIRSGSPGDPPRPKDKPEDPSLWSAEDIDAYFDKI